MLLCFDVFGQECPNALLLDIGIILHKLSALFVKCHTLLTEFRVSHELLLLGSFSCSHDDVKLRKSLPERLLSQVSIAWPPADHSSLLALESHYPWVTCGPPMDSGQVTRVVTVWLLVTVSKSLDNIAAFPYLHPVKTEMTQLYLSSAHISIVSPAKVWRPLLQIFRQLCTKWSAPKSRCDLVTVV